MLFAVVERSIDARGETFFEMLQNQLFDIARVEQMFNSITLLVLLKHLQLLGKNTTVVLLK